MLDEDGVQSRKHCGLSLAEIGHRRSCDLEQDIPDPHDESVLALSELSDTKARSVDPILRRYLERGSELGGSPAELNDYFRVSSPSMPEQAGLTARQATAVEKRYEKLSQEIFGAKRR